MSFENLFKNAGRIGLMADSHGILTSIVKGVDQLKHTRAEMFIHLGDIFDSLHNDNLYEIFKTIAVNRFFAVKGNNDYQIETMLNNGHVFDLPPDRKARIKAFLAGLPMRLVCESICFTHSLPFESIRSFYEPIDTGTAERARQLFDLIRRPIRSCSADIPMPALFSGGKPALSRAKRSIRMNPCFSIHPRDISLLSVLRTAVNAGFWTWTGWLISVSASRCKHRILIVHLFSLKIDRDVLTW